MKAMRQGWFIPLLVWFALLVGRAAGAEKVDVILWFDTEDYILPADDDACKRLAELLTARKIRATFKVVGEKARVLEQRGRKDVIAALKKHDIAYHANFHSVHPTPTEYLTDCGWLDGMAEFVRREGAGALDVKRIFSTKTLACYGQPGSSWAPQTIGALKQIGVAPHGIPVYLDEGDHVGLEHKPFWYAGALNVYNMGPNCTRMDLHDPGAVEPAMQKADALAERLRQAGGGLISIYYHPCEWVHKQFWDGANFSRGVNPPREQWKLPQQRTATETDGAFERFAKYVDHINSIPGVRWVSASDLPEMYLDLAAAKGISQSELDTLVEKTITAKGGLDFQVLGKRALSLADQFEVLTLAVADLLKEKQPKFPLIPKGLLGPDNAPAARSSGMPVKITAYAFRDTTRDVLDFIQKERRVPARVFVGAETLSPAEFLSALAHGYTCYKTNQALLSQESIAYDSGLEVLPARHIAKDTPGLFGGWVIHKEGFRAPKVLEQARLQAWTLKPAIRAD